MIYFLVTTRNSFPIRNFLRSRGKIFADRIRIIPWEQIGQLRDLRAGSFIFSDIDFLNGEQREVAKQIYNQLYSRYPHLRLLNNPEKVLLRYDLLKRMAASGVNSFDVTRADGPLGYLRYPVFIREADRHTGPLTTLLYSTDEIKHELRKLNLLGYRTNQLLIIEYLDVADDNGIYSKYSAFVLGDRVMPRYLNFSRSWKVKSMVDANDDLMRSRRAEVETYMQTNPHEAWLKTIFAQAGITYGRADYALVNGKLQLWEINLNPAFVRPPRKITKDHQQQRMMRDSFYNRFLDALEKVDVNEPEKIQLTISQAEEKLMQVSFKEKWKEGFHNRLVKDKPHYRLMRKVCFGVASWLTR
ncbi:MAG: hypothetical protein HRU69_03800 [Flammeovirgaceae bacterium]|nr:MAG: hypothetical protein HRU69_03800 [Flammeovirgaceae bacterium]